MSLSLSEIQAVSDDYVEKGTTDIYFEDNVLLYMLMSGGKFMESLVQPGDLVDGGEKIREILEYDKSHSGAYGNTTKIPQSKVDILNAARFRWAGYYASNAIDLDDQVQNAGDAALVNLVHSKIDNIRKSIRDKMGDTIYVAAATVKDLLGLGSLFNTTTSTEYGSIAEDDMAKWKANTITDSVAISYKAMQTLRRTAAVGQSRSKRPNLYITTEALKDGFERTLQSQVRYQDKKLANAGFENITFGGQPVVADDKQTAGYCDALNLNYMKLRTHTSYKFTDPKWEYSKDQPDTLVANTRWVGQLTTNHRAAHCRRTGFTEPT